MPARIDDILAHFERTTDQFFTHDEFRARLESGKKLRIKFGVDVTAPTLHIGHAVNMWLLRYLQDRGHTVIFLIGDFTTRIGDPDGKLDTRPVIPRDEIDKNAEAFIAQAKRILRFDDPKLLEIRRNSEWLDKMNLQDFLNLLAQVTHARLISRDMFQRRIEDGREIYMHEMLYPILQGYDSVMIKSDLTIIGSDQLFNEMMGRFFQEKAGQKPQVILTTKITPGLDGKLKQSKSIGNYIGLAHSPRDKFGRVMSLPDSLIEEYFRIYTDLPLEEVEKMKDLIRTSPREAKLRLAYAIVGRYHGHEIAVWEREWFEHTVSKGLAPDDMPSLAIIEQRMKLLDLVVLSRKDKSRSDLRRLIAQGGVELNGEKRTDPLEEILLKNADVLKIGKRGWFRIEIVKLHDFETGQLKFSRLQLEDLDVIRKYLDEWEIIKYLARALPVQRSKAMLEQAAADVFRRVILQPEPKDQWLWKVGQKQEPEKIVGVAHLRHDGKGAGEQNIWLDPALKSEELLQEAAFAVNEYAFNTQGLSRVMMQQAFAQVSAPREMEVLRQRFMKMDASARMRDVPEGVMGITREGWEELKEWLARQRNEPAPEPDGKPKPKKLRDSMPKAGKKATPRKKAPNIKPAPEK